MVAAWWIMSAVPPRSLGLLVKNKEEDFRRAFDAAPSLSMMFKLIDGKWIFLHANFALIKFSNLKITKYIGMDIDAVFFNRPDLVEIAKKTYREKSITQCRVDYHMLTTNEDKVFDVTFVYFNETHFLIYVIDLTSEMKFKMRVAKAIYEGLTLMERDVLYYMVRGHSRRDMAHARRVSKQAIYDAIDRIREKSEGNLDLMVEYEKYRQKNVPYYVGPK
ncbi:MAG: hypothetical protein KA369_08205 [Spirochaetes bacterium]|nr:hypothetical protein [Spirochaetota bacterium]